MIPPIYAMTGKELQPGTKVEYKCQAAEVVSQRPLKHFTKIRIFGAVMEVRTNELKIIK